MRFFFDNCLSPSIAKAIGILDDGHQILHLREKFPANVTDVEWIKALASEGDWMIISGDPRITRNPQNRVAWKESKLVAFFFKGGWATQSLWDQAWRTVQWWPIIKKQAAKAKPGDGFLVPVRLGKLEPLRTD